MEKRGNFAGRIDKGTPATKKSHFGRCQKCEAGEDQTRADSTEQPMDSGSVAMPIPQQQRTWNVLPTLLQWTGSKNLQNWSGQDEKSVRKMEPRLANTSQIPSKTAIQQAC